MNWAYPVLMGAAVTTGLVVSRCTRQPLGLTTRQRLGLSVGAFCGAMLGAKLPFVLLDLEGFLSGAAWFDNGKTLVMGLVGGYFGVEIAKWSLHIRTKTGDSFAAPVAAAVAVGRLACFSAGCCHGAVTDVPWGVDFGDGLRRHPAQLYEFAFHLSCAFILPELRRRGLFKGQLIKLYIIAYLLFRFATEFIRPEPVVGLGLTAYQLAVLLFVPVFALLWWRDRRISLEMPLPLHEEYALPSANVTLTAVRCERET